LDDVLSDLDRLVVPGLVHWQHPSFFAYFPSNASFASVLAELVAAGLGVNAFSWESSPAATELELVVCEWMADALGLPARLGWASGGGGVIQDSASSATLSAIVAARARALLRGAEPDRLVAYASVEAHSSVAKGLRVAGVGDDRLRLVPKKKKKVR
jgi:aromatic-L-amino-acid decarboxylase